MDNKAAVTYVRCQGGTRSRSLLAKIMPIMNWVQGNLAHLSAVYIPALQNFLADTLSRKSLYHKEWSLNQSVFHWICKQWGYPNLDVMATTDNVKCKCFLSFFPRSGSSRCIQLQVGVQTSMSFSPIVLIYRLLN